MGCRTLSNIVRQQIGIRLPEQAACMRCTCAVVFCGCVAPQGCEALWAVGTGRGGGAVLALGAGVALWQHRVCGAHCKVIGSTRQRSCVTRVGCRGTRRRQAARSSSFRSADATSIPLLLCRCTCPLRATCVHDSRHGDKIKKTTHLHGAPRTSYPNCLTFSTDTVQNHPPVQLVFEVLATAGAVLPAGHAVQLVVSAGPPALQVPTLHCRHVALPKPGRQTARVG